MNKIQSAFNKNKVFLPVIHLLDKEQMLKNTIAAKEAGFDGVFLIDHNECIISLILKI